jgi:hypothetical protein
MSMRLTTVAEYIEDARVLLLDKVEPFRYTDTELLVAFNTALLEGRRLRADLFVTRFGNSVPHYHAVSGETVPIEPQFRLGFVYGIVGQALMRDDEDVQDTRAASFMGMFDEILTGNRQRTPVGGTPGPGNAQK